MRYLAGKVEAGLLKPVMPLEHIFAFAVTSLDGIVRDLTLARCYSLPGDDAGVTLDELSLTGALARSLLYLLGEA
ncbi:hypothetical protein D3C73_1331710 [compost metagenome]